MTDTDPCFLSVAEAVSVIAGKPLSPVELITTWPGKRPEVKLA